MKAQMSLEAIAGIAVAGMVALLFLSMSIMLNSNIYSYSASMKLANCSEAALSSEFFSTCANCFIGFNTRCNA
jgi:hypothetical protein